jgi:ABC-type transporter Mla subunit MlaD
VSRRPLSRSAQRLERHRALLGVLVLVAAAFATYVSIVAIRGLPFSHPYKVHALLPGGAPIVRPGTEVRIAGERAGQVSKVAVGRGGARVTLALDHGPLGRDTALTVRLRGLAGPVYIDVRPGRGVDVPAGGTLARGASTVQITDVIGGFDAAARKALSRSLPAYGAGVVGRGAGVNATLAELPSVLTDATPILRALRPRAGALAQLTAQGDDVLAALDTPALGGLVGAAGTTFVTTAARRADVAATIADLPGVEDAAAGTLPAATALLRDADAAAARLRPGVSALRAATPGIDRLTARGAEVDRLAGLLRAALPTLSTARPTLHALTQVADELSPVAVPLQALSAHLAPYRRELIAAPQGFDRWGGSEYPFGQAAGHKAVRFSIVFTCQHARDPYPPPEQAPTERKACTP